MLPVAPRARRFVAASVVRIGLAFDRRDLVLHAEPKIRREFNSAVGRIRGAGLFPVHHDVDLAEAEFLLVADALPLPFSWNGGFAFFERRGGRKRGKCSGQDKMNFHAPILPKPAAKLNPLCSGGGGYLTKMVNPWRTVQETETVFGEASLSIV